MADQPQASKSIPVLPPIGNMNPQSPPGKDGIVRMPSSPQPTSHRTSFVENLRGNPSSPRAHRAPSLTQQGQALQELLNNPPTANQSGHNEFTGRDWRTIQVGEIVDLGQVRFVEMSTTVEEATNALITGGSPNVVLLRDSPTSQTAIGTFDYSDLNAYLLLVVGLAQPDERHSSSFKELAQKGREGQPIPLRDVKDLGKKEPLITLPHSANLTKAVEVFGSGIHRIIVVKEHTADVVGVLTQLRLVRFFWEHRHNFPVIEPLYQRTLRELDIASHSVIAIHGDRPLTDALELMNNEGITSLPVLDHQRNVIGNISHVDVRLLTKNTSLPLLRSSCIHFISVILSERGVNDGKDSYPVFYVNPFSTLAHTVAKLVATVSHRMWVVESPSPASSGPPTPLLTPSAPVLSANLLSSGISASPSLGGAPTTLTGAPPLTSAPVTANLSTGSLPPGSLSGHLAGVVSLTDILNVFAKASGLHPNDPNDTRRQRRRSSSASVRRSVESSRSESVGGGSISGGDLSRRGSISGAGRR
ncbi:hypothetical protein EJ06DRAFT_530699 [Trichodelitschia bisporula]|uniref:Protein SDS23 n=1 Tax=Trichodelitschia bisporula TaxID=703511 RepID=A0A6G1HV36_9PEZI|nr:hypothetical protein EJ06DRAFT_530699 [Trichodelitschia bisporula]